MQPVYFASSYVSALIKMMTVITMILIIIKVEKNINDDDYKKKKNDERILRVCPEGSSKPEELLQTCTGLVIA